MRACGLRYVRACGLSYVKYKMCKKILVSTSAVLWQSNVMTLPGFPQRGGEYGHPLLVAILPNMIVSLT